MTTIRDEIREAVDRLRLPPSAFAEVPAPDNRLLFDSFLRRFTGNVNARWWWEHFTLPSTSIHLQDNRAFERLTRVVPNPDEKFWFVAEETELPFYPVYETTPAAAQQVIGECYGFEYYLIAKDLRWLLCETHHNVLIALGPEIQRKIHALQPDAP